jgi:uncharacterized membrane protein HdeD (DUF308 family)
MSSVSDYFERMTQRQYETSKWPLIVGGLLFLVVGCVSLMRSHDLSRAASPFAIGIGTILYGITEIRLRRTQWRVPPLILALVFWFGGACWMIR